jgi:hypothetical protein
MSDINTLNTVLSSDPISNDNTIINSVQLCDETLLNSKDLSKNDVKIILNDVEEKIVSHDPITIINSSIPILPVICVPSLHLDKYLSFINDDNIKQLVTILTNNEGSIKDISNIVNLIIEDGKIDMNDVPLLISFLKKLISLKTVDFKELKNLAMSDYIKAIKLVLIILAKENILKLPDTNQFVTDVSKILDNLLIVEQVGSKMCSCFPLLR